jgi:hypothetical protein
MTHITREVIEERVRIFVDSVRGGVESFMKTFKPEITWWLVKETKSSKEKYPDAILLLDQMGILEDDMKKHYTSHWASKIGDGTFGDVLRQGKDKRSIFVTVRSANVNDSSNTSPLDDPTKIVGGDLRSARYSKSPWVMLRDSICGTVPDQVPTFSTPSPHPRAPENIPTAELKIAAYWSLHYEPSNL